MTLKEQLLEAIDVLPSSKLVEALVLIQSLEVPPSVSFAKSFFKHLQTIGVWSGSDLEDCLYAVESSNGEAIFDYDLNPFD